MKGILLLIGNKPNRALKKEINELISKGELKIYQREWYLKSDSTPIGKVKSIRWNDKKKTNIIEVELKPQVAHKLTKKYGWAPEYHLSRPMTTQRLHVNFIY